MLKKILFLFLLSPLASSAFAENYSLLIGGGGELGEKTLFDNQMEYFTYQKKFSPNFEMIFNGGHKELEKNINTFYGMKNVPRFTQKNYEEKIKDLSNKIKNGTIKGDDQILLSIFSHGSMMEKGLDSHRISLSTENQSQQIDLLNLSGSDTVSLDSLKELVALAEKNGVKLGIIDQSCYGGASLNLARDLKNVCILSGAAANSPNIVSLVKGENPIGMTKSSLKAFSEAFSKSPKNLEELYLDILNNVHGPALPQMSGKEAAEVYEKVEKLIEGKTEIFDFSSNQNVFFEEDKCVDTQGYIKEVQLYFEGLQNGVLKESQEYKKLISSLKDYQNKKTETGSRLLKLDKNLDQLMSQEIKFQSKETDASGRPVSSLSYNLFTFYSLSEADFEASEKHLKAEYKKNKTEELKRQIDLFIEAKKERRKVEKEKNSPYALYASAKIDFQKSTLSLGRETVEVQTALNRLKAKVYEMTLEKKEQNPCRDFKLN